jgi:meiotically up-regulated gene 157 (Mug157) protein
LVVSAKNNLLHEAFSVANPAAYTREWFAWANSFFGETIVYLHSKKLHLVNKL